MQVPANEELRRIAALPRRTADRGAELVEPVTRVLRRVTGTMTMRPVQALALVEIAEQRGGLLPMSVGSGKTVVTFLAGRVLGAERPVVIVPGGLLDKTRRDFSLLDDHWAVPKWPAIISYDRLGRAHGGDVLAELNPDLLICDECHALRNLDTAACARVVGEYCETKRPMFVGLSGTITGGSLRDYAHVQRWALRDNAFLPSNYWDLDLWRRAVDAEVEAGARVAPGALLTMPHDEHGTKLARARSAVSRRMVETPGVVRTTESGVDSSLRVSVHDSPRVCTDEVWSRLRDWQLPNGDDCLDGFEVHRHARELACGYYSVWDPAPPKEWYRARKMWARIVRRGIRDKRCNTEVEARGACKSWREYHAQWQDPICGVVDETVSPEDACAAWLGVRESYVPTPVPVWLDTATLESCAKWARRRKTGIIWTRHIPFGERLERDYGITYYREQGLNLRGKYIESATGVICASVDANATGRNLQTLTADNLIVSPFGAAEMLEQLIGRTHRPGQTADCVNVDMLVACGEHAKALVRAKRKAAAIQALTTNPQKILYADWAFDPSKYLDAGDPRWASTIIDEEDE